MDTKVGIRVKLQNGCTIPSDKRPLLPLYPLLRVYGQRQPLFIPMGVP